MRRMGFEPMRISTLDLETNSLTARTPSLQKKKGVSRTIQIFAICWPKKKCGEWGSNPRGFLQQILRLPP